MKPLKEWVNKGAVLDERDSPRPEEEFKVEQEVQKFKRASPT